jgi:hypothetical protein
MNQPSYKVMEMCTYFVHKIKHHDICLKSFQLQNDLYFIIRLHLKIQMKKKMLVELCLGNYLTHDDLVNGVIKIFQALNKLPNSQKVIWILFNNLKSGQLTITKKCTLLYTQNTSHMDNYKTHI